MNKINKIKKMAAKTHSQGQPWGELTVMKRGETQS
jgi:hypothetical protein